ncbi:MAG: hypothetical protein WC567_03915 [Kiritimatiellia bacterium]|jgi:hypothetical protein
MNIEQCPAKSPEEIAYDESLAKFRLASRKFREIQASYRAGNIGDQEFRAGRAAFDAAQEAADTAETIFINFVNS